MKEIEVVNGARICLEMDPQLGGKTMTTSRRHRNLWEALMLEKLTPLVLIDVQKGFLDSSWGSRNNPGAEKTISQLLKYWRQQGRPVIHIQHLSTEANSPFRPSQPGVDFMDEAVPLEGEVIFQKNVNSAFIGTDLERFLKSKGLRQIYFCGFTVDHCVSTSVRMAGNLGFSPSVIADATVAFDRVDHHGNRYGADLVHAISIASLNGEFAQICESQALVGGC
jgi:nicotinamidase-related amidase